MLAWVSGTSPLVPALTGDVELGTGRSSDPRLGLLAQVLELIPVSVGNENWQVSSATAGSPVSAASAHPNFELESSL